MNNSVQQQALGRTCGVVGKLAPLKAMREILNCDTAVERNYLFLYYDASGRELQTSYR
jgi:hypothetical protein